MKCVGSAVGNPILRPRSLYTAQTTQYTIRDVRCTKSVRKRYVELNRLKYVVYRYLIYGKIDVTVNKF